MNSNINLTARAQIPPETRVPILTLTSDTLNNTTLVNESLGIHYRASKENGIIRIRRLDGVSDHGVLVAEWRQRSMGKDVFKFFNQSGQENLGSQNLNRISSAKYIPRTMGRAGSSKFDRIYQAEDGKRYVWKSREDELACRPVDNIYRGNGNPVAVSHRERSGVVKTGHQTTLELFPGYERILDSLVVTYLYAERRRRKGKRNSLIYEIVSLLGGF